MVLRTFLIPKGH